VTLTGDAHRDHRRASFVGLTIAKLASTPFGAVMGTYLTLLVATRARSAIAITFALTAHKYLSDRTLARIGRRVPYIASGFVVAGVAVWLFTVAKGYWPLVAAIVLAREASVVQRVARFAVTPDVFGRSRWLRAALLMAATTVLPGAGILAIIRFTWDQDRPTTWNLTFRIAAVGLIIAGIAVLALVREAPGSQVAAEAAARRSWREELRRFLALPNARVLLAAGGLLAGAGAATSRLFPVWANRSLGIGGPQLVDVSIATAVGAIALVPLGLWLAGRAHPRTLAVSAALFGAAVTTAHVLVSDVRIFVLAAVITVPLTVAAVVAGLPLVLRLVPPGESLGETLGVFLGPFSLLTTVAAYASALLVDAFDDYRLIWVVAGAFTLAAAGVLRHLEVPVGAERSDVRELLRRARRANRAGGGLFSGAVSVDDVVGGAADGAADQSNAEQETVVAPAN